MGYFFDYRVDVRCCVGVDLVYECWGREVGQDDATVFFDDLYSQIWVFERSAARHCLYLLGWTGCEEGCWRENAEYDRIS